MTHYPQILAKSHIDMYTGCYVRFVYGGIDAFWLHTHDFYEVFLVTKGSVPHMVNGVMQNLPEGSLVFVRSEDVHAHRCDDPETAFINFSFTKETTMLLFEYLFDQSKIKEMLYCDMPPIVLLDKSSTKKLVSQIDTLNTANWKDKNALRIRMRTVLANVFSYFSNAVPEQKEEMLPLWLTKLSDMMSKPENFILGIDQMIMLSGKSREHVSRSVKKYYGVSVTDYINDLRVNYASNLLINTNIPIIDVCYNCGFQSVSYFYRVFKEKNTVSPSAFRKSYKDFCN